MLHADGLVKDEMYFYLLMEGDIMKTKSLLLSGCVVGSVVLVVSVCMNVRLWWKKYCMKQFVEYQKERVENLSDTIVEQRRSIEMLLEENRALHKMIRVNG